MGTNAIAIRPQQNVSRFDQREVIQTIKETVCRGATDAQLKMFLEVCKATGLDPFLKEIWFVAEKSIIMAGRDGYLRVANEHPQFDGIETRVERGENSIPIKAVCTVWRKDRNHPTVCEAYYNEYNKQSPVWKQYPSAMIGKVAEVLALKRSFAINGVVTEEEIGGEPVTGGSKQAQQEVLDRKLAEIKERQEQPTEDLPMLDRIIATFTTAKEIDKAFATLRIEFCKVFDAETFSQILAENGMAEGQTRTIRNAKAAFRAAWMTLEKATAEIQTAQEPAQ